MLCYNVTFLLFDFKFQIPSAEVSGEVCVSFRDTSIVCKPLSSLIAFRTEAIREEIINIESELL